MEEKKKIVIPGYCGNEWQYGYLNYMILEFDDKTTTCLFYNLNKEKYFKVSSIPFESLKYFSDDVITKENIRYKTGIKFKTSVFGFDLDQIVYLTAVLIVAYGAFYNRDKYLIGNTTYDYKNGGQIFISSIVVTNLNYIRYMALKNNSPDDFVKVLDVLDEDIKELQSNLTEITEENIDELDIL